MIQTAVKMVSILFLTAAIPGGLRMFFRGLSMVYWPERLPAPAVDWITSFMAATLFELLYFGIAYVIVIGLFLLLVKGVFKDNLTLKATLLISAIHSLVGYLVVAGTEIWRSPGLENPFALAGIYIVAGLVYGLLYYRWIVAAKVITVNMSRS